MPAFSFRCELRRSRRAWLRVASGLACILFFACSNSQAQTLSRVLIIYETGTTYPATRMVDEAIQDSLRSSGHRIQIYREYMETSLFPDEPDQKRFREFFLRKYLHRRPDVIITMGSGPLTFMSELHDENFPGLPVIFSLPNGAEKKLKLGADFTGVTRELRAAETVSAALKLLPDTKQIFVVAGAGDFEKQQLSDVKHQLSGLKDIPEIRTVEGLELSTLEQRLSRLPPHSFVLFTSYSKDPTGIPVTSRETGPLIAKASNVPVFVLFDVYLNHGEVGGDVCDIADQGRIAGDMAVRVLNGQKASEIPRAIAANKFVFDLRALVRWGLKVNDLPPGSILLNRPPSIWGTYKWYIVASVSVLIVELLLIVALLRNELQRKKAELELSQTYERLRLALNSGKAIAWELKIDTREVRLFGDLHDTFGFSPKALKGKLLEFMPHIHSEDRRRLRRQLVQAIRSGEAFSAEFRLLREDGSLRWVSMRGTLTESKRGVPEGIRGIATDITDRKASQEAFTTLTGRLINSQEEERRRIAREIHDDWGQVVTVISIDLRRVEKLLVDNPAERQQLSQIRQRLYDLGGGLRSLSHSLHSPSLELIGLVGGLKSLCNEFTQKQEFEVKFIDSNVPADVPADLALCLFRITQEALRNSKKHSGTNKAVVDLRWSMGNLQLSISDLGVGFDPESPQQNAGLGLRSMEERLRSTGGHLEIWSQRGRGTRIRATVPFEVANTAAELKSA